MFHVFEKFHIKCLREKIARKQRLLPKFNLPKPNKVEWLLVLTGAHTNMALPLNMFYAAKNI